MYWVILCSMFYTLNIILRLKVRPRGWPDIWQAKVKASRCSWLWKLRMAKASATVSSTDTSNPSQIARLDLERFGRQPLVFLRKS